MLNISDQLKSYFLSDSARKRLFISIPQKPYTGKYNKYNGRYSNEVVYYEDFSLKESVMDNVAELVGCISSEMQVKLQMTNKDTRESDFKGLAISASIAIIESIDSKGDETLSEKIPLFTGYIDSAKMDYDKQFIQLTCYDKLAYLGDTLIYNDYKRAFLSDYNPEAKGGVTTIKGFRDSIFGALGLPQEDVILPNDMVKIKKRSIKKNMSAISLIMNICQINGCFGIINREGKFEYKFVQGNSGGDYGAYPSKAYPGQVYPSQSIVTRIDTQSASGTQYIPYYRSLTYERQYISILNKGINIRTNEKDKGVVVDWEHYTEYTTVDWDDDSEDDYIIGGLDDEVDSGLYVIESNLIAHRLSRKKKRVMASNIMARIGINNPVVFRKYNAVCNGLPFIQCGDKIIFSKKDNPDDAISFIVTTRTLKGIQSMTDIYECSPKMEYDAKVSQTTPVSLKTDDGEYVSNVNKIVDGAIDPYESISDSFLLNEEVMVVVEWDEETKILKTTSKKLGSTGEENA